MRLEHLLLSVCCLTIPTWGGRRTRIRPGKLQQLTKIQDSLKRLKALQSARDPCSGNDKVDCGRSAGTVNSLISDLLDNGYNADTRPVINVDQNITVGLGTSLQEIESLESESTGAMRCRLMLKLKWKDYQLEWDPLDYNGIKRISVDPKRIWTPDIDLYNSVHAEHNYNVKARIDSDGDVEWHVPVHYTVTCSHEFRSDSWHCPIIFRSTGYTGEELDLQPIYQGAEMDMAEVPESEHFIVLSTASRRSIDAYSHIQPDLYPSIVTMIKIQRRIGHPTLYGKRNANFPFEQ